MAWDTEGTKRKIKDAATAEFTLRGPAGTTVERIAKRVRSFRSRMALSWPSRPPHAQSRGAASRRAASTTTAR